MTEAEHIAAETWLLMARADAPMPPAIGLDRVQDVAGSRQMAKIHLFDAGREWLRGQMPYPPDTAAGEEGEFIAHVTNAILDALTRYRNALTTSFIAAARGVLSMYPALQKDWHPWMDAAERVFDVLAGVWAASNR